MKKTLVIRVSCDEDNEPVFGIVEVDSEVLATLESRFSKAKEPFKNWGSDAPRRISWTDGHCILVSCADFYSFLAKHLTSAEAYRKHLPSIVFFQYFDKDNPFDPGNPEAMIASIFEETDAFEKQFLVFHDLPDYTGERFLLTLDMTVYDESDGDLWVYWDMDWYHGFSIPCDTDKWN